MFDSNLVENDLFYIYIYGGISTPKTKQEGLDQILRATYKRRSTSAALL